MNWLALLLLISFWSMSHCFTLRETMEMQNFTLKDQIAKGEYEDECAGKQVLTT
jgi:hypothetical protein